MHLQMQKVCVCVCVRIYVCMCVYISGVRDTPTAPAVRGGLGILGGTVEGHSKRQCFETLQKTRDVSAKVVQWSRLNVLKQQPGKTTFFSHFTCHKHYTFKTTAPYRSGYFRLKVANVWSLTHDMQEKKNC